MPGTRVSVCTATVKEQENKLTRTKIYLNIYCQKLDIRSLQEEIMEFH